MEACLHKLCSSAILSQTDRILGSEQSSSLQQQQQQQQRRCAAIGEMQALKTSDLTNGSFTRRTKLYSRHFIVRGA